MAFHNRRKETPAKKFKTLGRQTSQPLHEVELIPWVKSHPDDSTKVTLECHEFTSHCPVTGQPDFGKLTIEYYPRNSLIETKSLKLYLWSYRNAKNFNEEAVRAIAQHLARTARPVWLRVVGTFNTRGGIGVTCSHTISPTSAEEK